MIRLIFHTGPRAGTEVTTSAESIRIGRNPEFSDVVLADAMASQRHCQLTRTPQGGTRMLYTQGPLAKPEHTEGSRQGVMGNLEQLAKALGE